MIIDPIHQQLGRVTRAAVREQPTEPAECPTYGAHPHNGPGIVHGGATCLDCPICRPPAAESVPVDVLDLVRQYVANRANEGEECTCLEAGALFARIEAEVNRLRDERDDYATLMKLTAAERDAARTEVERLKGELAAEEEGRRQDWVDRLTPPDPLVLTPPQVPEGAVALVGEVTGHRWVPSEFGRWVDEQTGQVRDFAEVLTREHAVTVEMASPREPRTWPKLDSELEVKCFTGKSGTRYVRSTLTDSYAAFVAAHNVGAERELLLSATRSHWQEIDGPLVEVFDEDGAGR